MYAERKIKAIGVDNFTQEKLADFLFFNKVKSAVNMIECNAFYQRKEDWKYMQEQNIQMKAWSPLAAGAEDLFTNPVLGEIAKKYGTKKVTSEKRFLPLPAFPVPIAI